MDQSEISALVLLLRKMGHDMRVPLNTLISTSDMLVQGVYDPLTTRQEKAVVRVQRNSRRLLAVLDDFLTYIKADTGDLELKPQPFDPRTQIEAWCSPVRPVLEEKGVAFGLTTSDEVPALLVGDEPALQRMVQALLWNAVAHTTQGAVQVISTWLPDQQWSIQVRDSGSGISGDDLPHIFEPFWRGEERPQLPTAGAGLGLPMTLALARLMGGSLFLQETSPQGSQFCIQVPVSHSTPGLK